MDKRDVIQARQDFFDAFDISAEQFLNGIEILAESRSLVNQKVVTAKNIEEFNSDFDEGIKHLREIIADLEKWQSNATEFLVQHCMSDEIQTDLPVERDPNKMPWDD